MATWRRSRKKAADAAESTSLYEWALGRITAGQNYPVESRALQIGLLVIRIAGYLGAALSVGVLLAIVVPHGWQVSALGLHLVSNVRAFLGNWGLTVGTLGPVAWLQDRTLRSTYRAATGAKPTISFRKHVVLQSEGEGLVLVTAVVSTLLSLLLGLSINAVGTALISRGTDFWYEYQKHLPDSAILGKVLGGTLTEWLFDLVYLVRTNLINRIVSAKRSASEE